MKDILRLPVLVIASVVERLRRLPGARFVAPLVPWLARGLLVVAVVLVALWMFEASPQRITIGELASGRLGSFQSWVIVSGVLADEPGDTSVVHTYRMTDPAAPDAYLVVRSRVELPLGPTTLSGHIEGGREPVPEGFQWSARLNADPVVAQELPPPMAAFVLAGIALLVMLARRTQYPMFVTATPGVAVPTPARLNVVAHGPIGPSGGRDTPATLDLDSGTAGTAALRIRGGRPLPVRLNSTFTNIDVGDLRRLGSAEPALRVRAADEEIYLGFASARERDAAFATLSAGARPQPRSQRSSARPA